MQAISNEELERRFDEGEDITEYMDLSTVRHPNQERAASRIVVDVPEQVAVGLDRAARRMGVSRKDVIRVWLSERLDEEADREARRLVTA